MSWSAITRHIFCNVAAAVVILAFSATHVESSSPNLCRSFFQPSDIITELAKIPSERIKRYGGARPDDKGYFLPQRDDGLFEVGLQRQAGELMVASALLEKDDWYQEAMSAIRVAVTHQNRDGSFGDLPEGLITTNAFFLSSVLFAMTVTEKDSVTDPAKKVALAEITPALEAASEWLLAHEVRLAEQNATSPNRLLISAVAFMSAYHLFREDKYLPAAFKFHRLATAKLRTSDLGGLYFLEKGGFDTSYQGVAIMMLVRFVALSPRCEGTIATGLAMEWLRLRINSDGSVQTAGNTRTGGGQECRWGMSKGVNHKEIAQTFDTYCVLGRHDWACDIAESVYLNEQLFPPKRKVC